MNAHQLLQLLKSAIERESGYLDDEVLLSLSGTADKAFAIVTVPIEGKTRIIEIKAREIGIHEGLRESVHA
jgi:hypothetical protein